MTQRGVETVTGKRQVQNQKPWLIEIIIHSKYFPDSDWLEAHI